MREYQRHRDGTDRRGSPQPTEAARASMQDVGGIDRQQRGRSAKQHSEQVERDRGKNQFVFADEIHAFEQRFAGGRRCVHNRLAAIAETEETDQGQTRADELHDVHCSASSCRQKDVQRPRDR